MLLSPQILIPTRAKVTAAGGGLGLQTNLSVFFSLDDLTDATGTITNLTNNGTATFGAGLVGNCVTFVSASSQSLSHASVSALQLGGVDFSISFWAKIASFADKTIVSRNSGAFGDREFYIGTAFVSGQNFQFQVINSGGTAVTLSATSFGGLSTATWYHVVATFKASTGQMIVYVNTVSDTVTSLTGSVPSSASELRIGNDGGGNLLDGSVDQLGIWKNRVLSAGDVSLLYNSGAGLSYAAMA